MVVFCTSCMGYKSMKMIFFALVVEQRMQYWLWLRLIINITNEELNWFEYLNSDLNIQILVWIFKLLWPSSAILNYSSFCISFVLCKLPLWVFSLLQSSLQELLRWERNVFEKTEFSKVKLQLILLQFVLCKLPLWVFFFLLQSSLQELLLWEWST